MAVKPNILICGASRGIGLGLSAAFLQAGWHVQAVVRSSAADSPLEQLRAQWPEQLSVIVCNLTDADAGQRLQDALHGRRLKCLLLNAGVYGPAHQDPQQTTAEELGQLMLTNAVAPVRLARQLAGQVDDGGVIAFMSSQMASVELALAASMPLYGASKAALNSLLRSWDASLAQRPWSLLALHPGWVRTDMGGDAAPLSVEQSANGLRQVIESQLEQRQCTFLDYQGQTLAW